MRRQLASCVLFSMALRTGAKSGLVVLKRSNLAAPMKHDDLRSIGHNIAHSLASGIGLMIGVYNMDISKKRVVPQKAL
jgi:hypothetical protein